MLAIVRGSESSVALDIPASVEWTISELRRHGEARVIIPRDSSAWIEEVINDSGGFFFDIPTPFGTWRGIADIPSYTQEGADIIVRNVTHWVAIRNVGYRTFYGLTAGAIAKEAIRHGLLTILPITVGSIIEAPPIIPEYEFRGQSVMEVFGELSELTSQTWEIDDFFRVSWIPRQGKYHDTWIIDDGRLLDNIQSGSLGDTFSEIIEIDDAGRRFSSFNSAPALWPQQEIVN